MQNDSGVVGRTPAGVESRRDPVSCLPIGRRVGVRSPLPDAATVAAYRVSKDLEVASTSGVEVG